MKQRLKFKDLHITEQFFLIIGILFFGYLFLVQFVCLFFDAKTYMENSSDSILTNVRVVKDERIGYGFGTGIGSGKIIYGIQSRGKYYDLIHYEKDKTDNFMLYHADRLASEDLIIKINKQEYINHSGEKDDPIPLFYFKLKNGKEYYPLDIASYEYSVKRYLVYEKIFRSNIIIPILLVFLVISFLLFITYRLFVYMKK